MSTVATQVTSTKIAVKSGNVSLTLTGMTKDREAEHPLSLSWHIPPLHLKCIRNQANKCFERDISADTLLINTKEQSICLTYRYAITGLPERFLAQVTLDKKESINEQ